MPQISMKFILWLIAGLWLCPIPLTSQTYTLSGRITDEKDRPLPGASVMIAPSNGGAVTGGDGQFLLENLPSAEYLFTVAFLGYERHTERLSLKDDLYLEVKLVPSFQSLHEVVITDDYAEKRIAEDPLSIEIVNDAFLRQHLGGSLMQSIERLPGVSTIDIGQGLSKPVIRGLSFNRVVVAENGIRHEGQQWGADHGLEIDQYANDRIEVIKGPSSLMHGSDAIGGVIDLKQHGLPEKYSVGGAVDLTGKSNNALLGSSASLFVRGAEFYMTLRGTWMDYGDYRVPADSVDIYSYRAPLHDRQMRNTAGNEKNLHFSAGYIQNGFSSRLFVSNISGRNGFFANAHGLEPRRVDTVLHDRSSRDIQYPFHKVNHLKVISRTAWRKEDRHLEVDLGFQHNFRQEWSEYVSHGYMPALFPDTLSFHPDLEREFDKMIYTGNIRGGVQLGGRSEVTAGISAEYQDNAIDGRGFIIPAFTQQALGSFLYLKHYLSENSLVHAGIRVDGGLIRTDSYHDWFSSQPDPDNDSIRLFLQRADDLERRFSSHTWSLGYNLNLDHFSLKLNAGKSFRMPIAKELAANGVNYHRFSYEVGNAGLDPEVAYQVDGGAEWHNRRLAIGITPFAGYFPNYIYLNPGYTHDRLYGNGNQVFTYTQSRVARYGGEIHAHYQLLESWKLGLIGEYIYSVQLSGAKRGFTLPFSPPASLLLNAKYLREQAWVFRAGYLSLDVRMAAAQQRIVPPEEITASYVTLNLGAGGKVLVGKQEVSVSLQVRNLLNNKYFNHTSYYRLINVPEPGRGVVVNISVPFAGDMGNSK
ncbi:MAG: TonB-dependent receptor [Bacteroidales bacterium]